MADCRRRALLQARTHAFRRPRNQREDQIYHPARKTRLRRREYMHKTRRRTARFIKEKLVCIRLLFLIKHPPSKVSISAQIKAKTNPFREIKSNEAEFYVQIMTKPYNFSPSSDCF